LLVGRDHAARPDPVQAAWLYAQMVRWGQAPLSAEMLAAAKAVFRPDLYDAASGTDDGASSGTPADGIGAFAGPAFDADDIEGHLAAWDIKRG
jgi:NitT/TauT family transport system ATP-binding protein